jgi:hypothetical protein
MLVAFLIADHERLGRDACGSWRRWSSAGHDLLRMILEQLQASRVCVIQAWGSAEIGRGLLQDPRALALSNASTGASDARIFVADAGSCSIKVFDSLDFVAEVPLDAAGVQISESCGRRCPLGLALTSRGDLVVAQGEREGLPPAGHARPADAWGGRSRAATLLLFDRTGVLLREIVRDLPFKGPYTLATDCADRITVLHRSAFLRGACDLPCARSSRRWRTDFLSLAPLASRTGLVVFDAHSAGVDSAPVAQIEFADMHAVRTEWEASRRRREEELQMQIVELKGLSGTERAVTLIVEEPNLIGQARFRHDCRIGLWRQVWYSSVCSAVWARCCRLAASRAARGESS